MTVFLQFIQRWMEGVRQGWPQGEVSAYMDLLSSVRRSRSVLGQAAPGLSPLVGVLCGALTNDREEVRELSSQALALLIEAAGRALWESGPIPRAEVIANLLRTEPGQRVPTPLLRVLVALFLSMQELPMEHLTGFLAMWNEVLANSRNVTDAMLNDLQQPLLSFLQFAIERLEEVRRKAKPGAYVTLQKIHLVPILRNSFKHDNVSGLLPMSKVVRHILLIARLVAMICLETPSEQTSIFVCSFNKELIALLNRLDVAIERKVFNPLNQWRYITDILPCLPAVSMTSDVELRRSAQSLLFACIRNSSPNRERATLIALETNLSVLRELTPALTQHKSASYIINFTKILLSYTEESSGPVASLRDEISAVVDSLQRLLSHGSSTNEHQRPSSLVQSTLPGYLTSSATGKRPTIDDERPKLLAKRPFKISYDSRTHKAPRFQLGTDEADGNGGILDVDDVDPIPLEEENDLRGIQARPQAPAPKPFSITSLLSASSSHVESTPKAVASTSASASSLNAETLLAGAYDSRSAALTIADFDTPLEPLYAKILKFMHIDEPPEVSSKTAESATEKEILNPVLLRFLDGEHYINTFNPLLISEFRAALSAEASMFRNGKSELRQLRMSCVGTNANSSEPSLSESSFSLELRGNLSASKKYLGFFQRDDLVIIVPEDIPGKGKDISLSMRFHLQ